METPERQRIFQLCRRAERLRLPLPAAQFARIRGRAVLLHLDTDLLLLMPEEQPDEPKES